MNKKQILLIVILAVTLLIFNMGFQPQTAYAFPSISVDVGESEGPEDFSTSLQILFLLTILSLAPAILILMTSFTRTVIVLSFVRNGLATQQMPPNQVLVGLALFLTFFVMAPVWGEVNESALQPYLEGEMEQDEALETAMDPIRQFMFDQTGEKEIALFINFSEIEEVSEPSEVPTYILVPAFAISELKTAFTIGFIIYIPFLVIDMVVASTLMSMGMMMLPPVMISLPFKVLLFVLADGWNLVINSLLHSF
ncbi:flagellar type III secretion system pore protein FliP [Proteinivorax hydrogeniformans]|uniref:Flagellar biosynthetic protein FliP n=1 Tax=Proteinivorax hydrogeniformans TaxID=1826727 RepID=A0AAU8HQP3_9FIRM